MENHWLQFGGEDGPALIDPTVKTESIGSDSVEATALGVKNLERVIDGLVPATTKRGEDYQVLKDMYENVLDHWARWMGSVVKLIGGVVEHRTLGGRGQESFRRVPREDQKRALQFLLDQAFHPPRFLLKPEILNRIYYFGVDDPVLKRQKDLLGELLSGMRYRLLMDGEIVDPGKSYALREFLEDCQDGLFGELRASRPHIDPHRRSLQRHYLEHIKGQLIGPEPVPVKDRYSWIEEWPKMRSTSPRASDFPALIRASLENLAKRLENALPNVDDLATQAHLKDGLRRIEILLKQETEGSLIGDKEKPQGKKYF
jgi:hypothetical protein